jgi:hypothetical protein
VSIFTSPSKGVCRSFALISAAAVVQFATVETFDIPPMISSGIKWSMAKKADLFSHITKMKVAA